MDDLVCVLRCKGGINAKDLYLYKGPEDCWLNYTLHRGRKSCVYGCLGDGHCATICPKNAIKLGQKRLPIINTELCDGCGICVKECPKKILELLPRSHLVYLACKSLDDETRVRVYCSTGCTGCGICVKVCPYSAISLKDNLPIIEYERCNSCGICVHKCPFNCFVDRAIARPYGIISLKCDGCGECIKVCQFGAINGKTGQRHIIDKARCIGCGRCFEVCPIRAITMAGALGYTNAA
ncbi:MAG: 4Fe-4S binding protein [candidate division WOR-3 bacterium]|nr:4Fe-4S binding protein [candidate division WOR-3 bacterium]